jgi:cytochrome c551/c552
LYSFNQKETGKELFIKNCSACHKEDRYFVAPPFQKIRNDYGLNWTARFIKNPFKLFEEKDSRALYGRYKFQLAQPAFNMSNQDLNKILEYVDSFPYDSVQYQYRKLSEKERRKFIDSVETKR